MKVKIIGQKQIVPVWPCVIDVNNQGSHSTGKMLKSNSRQGKHWAFENFGKIQEKHREFENFLIKSLNQESLLRKNCCVMSMVLFFTFKMSYYCENMQGKVKLHREITGKTRGILFYEMSENHVLNQITITLCALTSWKKYEQEQRGFEWKEVDWVEVLCSPKIVFCYLPWEENLQVRHIGWNRMTGFTACMAMVFHGIQTAKFCLIFASNLVVKPLSQIKFTESI